MPRLANKPYPNPVLYSNTYTWMGPTCSSSWSISVRKSQRTPCYQLFGSLMAESSTPVTDADFHSKGLFQSKLTKERKAWKRERKGLRLFKLCNAVEWVCLERNAQKALFCLLSASHCSDDESFSRHSELRGCVSNKLTWQYRKTCIFASLFLRAITNIFIKVIFPNMITYLDRTFEEEQNFKNWNSELTTTLNYFK
jgi:hypothetical protein